MVVPAELETPVTVTLYAVLGDRAVDGVKVAVVAPAV
jgi:hypothetical protein